MRNVRLLLLLVGLLALAAAPVLAQYPVSTPAPAAQATAQPVGQAMIRVANLLTDAGVIDVYVDGQLAASDVNPAAVSDWIEVPAGSATVTIVPAGETLDQAIIGPLTVNTAGQFTIAATGSSPADFAAQFINENVTRVAPNSAHITLVNTFSGAPAFNVRLSMVQPSSLQAAPTAEPVFNLGPVASGENASTFSVPAGLYNIRLVPSTQSSVSAAPGSFTNLPAFSNVALNPNTEYLFAISSTPDDSPWLVIQASTVNNQMQLEPVGGSSVSGSVELMPAPDGGTSISVQATGLQPGVGYVSLYYDNHTCDLEPYSAEDIIGDTYVANNAGVGMTSGASEDALEDINSVSVRLASDFTLLACADLHPA